MRKVIAAINITLDGYCDHTAGIPDAELHDHYTDMLKGAGILLYGRITYGLMEDYWPLLAENPSGEAHMDDFAMAIDRVPKIVFSRTRKELNWATATLATATPEEVVAELRQQPGGDIFLGSPSLIASFVAQDLIDEYQLCIHPVIVGGGLTLFKGMPDRRVLKLVGTKVFASGVVLHRYVRHDSE